MKKGLLVLLLAVAMVVPAFAAKGDMSIDGKLGLGLTSNVSYSWEADAGYKLKTKMPFMLGAEFFYGVLDSLSVGVGVNYFFDTEMKFASEYKGGTTNIYLAVKPEAKIDSDIFSSIYLIGQIGLSMGRVEIAGESLSLDNGLYLGAGLGTTIKDAFFVELVFSSSNSSYDEGGYTLDFEYTVTSLNIGYKFVL